VQRESEARIAAEVLGVPEGSLTFLRFPDGGIDAADIDQFLRMMLLIRSHRPSVLYTPNECEFSHDHQQAYQLVLRAADMAQSSNYLPDESSPAWRIPVILGYEVWTPLSRFQYIEDITGFADRKVEALSAYRSQSHATKMQSTYAGPAGAALSAYRGAMALGGFAEAFVILRGDTLFTGL
jgi:LmbE family N-acetylglucosaminyl deacetylase